MSFLVLILTSVQLLSVSMTLAWALRSDPCNIHWLHAPRTIASFCLSVQHACDERSFLKQAKASSDIRMAHGCPTLKPYGTAYGNRYHKGITGGDMTMLNTFVTVLRAPRERFMSNFCDGLQHHHGLSQEHKDRIGFKMTHGDRFDNISAVQESLQAYVDESKITFGCYVRMLTGSMCSDASIVVDKELTNAAIKNLDQFLFVGVSEDYELAVQTFLAVAASAAHAVDAATFVVNEATKSPAKYRYELQPPDPVELRVIGEASHNTACERIARMLLTTGKVQYEDPFDQAVYDHAAVLFEKFTANTTTAGTTTTTTGTTGTMTRSVGVVTRRTV